MNTRVGSITPPPSEEEAAAIVAAIEALWPRPSAAARDESPSTSWRFSGRWWASNHLARRGRPGR